MIKLVVIDLNGTLLSNQKEISLRNKQTLMAAKQTGMKVIICTGRPLAAIDPYLEELGLQGEGGCGITLNGGLVQENDTGAIIEETLMPLEVIHELYQLTTTLSMPFDVLSDGVVMQLPSAPNYPSIYSSLNKLLTLESYRLEELTPNRIYNKVVVAIDGAYLNERIKEVLTSFYERFEITRTRNNLLEFMPKGITKTYGTSLLAKNLGIRAEEIMTLGDEENDSPMIGYAGLGVTIVNAIPLVKEAADVATDTNDQDGVAKTVEEYILAPLEEGR